MTEKEELELLELENENAHAHEAAPPPEEKSLASKALEAGNALALHGMNAIASGTLPSYAGIGGLSLHGVSKALHAIAPKTFDASPFEDSSQAYYSSVSDANKQLDDARKEHPLPSLAGSIAGAAPGAIAAGVNVPAQVALSMARGAGSSNGGIADRAENAINEGGKAAALGLGAKALGPVGDYIANKYGAARTAFAAEKGVQLERGVNSARGSLGGSTAAANRAGEVILREAESGQIPAADAMREIAGSPKMLDLRDQVARNYADAFPGLEGKMQTDRAALEAAKAALGSGREQAFEHPFRTIAGDTMGAGAQWAKNKISNLIPQGAKDAASLGMKTPGVAWWGTADNLAKTGAAAYPLAQAAARGPEAVKVTTFLLANNPAHAELRKKLSTDTDKQETP